MNARINPDRVIRKVMAGYNAKADESILWILGWLGYTAVPLGNGQVQLATPQGGNYIVSKNLVTALAVRKVKALNSGLRVVTATTADDSGICFVPYKTQPTSGKKRDMGAGYELTREGQGYKRCQHGAPMLTPAGCAECRLGDSAKLAKCEVCNAWTWQTASGECERDQNNHREDAATTEPVIKRAA